MVGVQLLDSWLSQLVAEWRIALQVWRLANTLSEETPFLPAKDTQQPAMPTCNIVQDGDSAGDHAHHGGGGSELQDWSRVVLPNLKTGAKNLPDSAVHFIVLLPSFASSYLPPFV